MPRHRGLFSGFSLTRPSFPGACPALAPFHQTRLLLRAVGPASLLRKAALLASLPTPATRHLHLSFNEFDIGSHLRLSVSPWSINTQRGRPLLSSGHHFAAPRTLLGPLLVLNKYRMDEIKCPMRAHPGFLHPALSSRCTCLHALFPRGPQLEHSSEDEEIRIIIPCPLLHRSTPPPCPATREVQGIFRHGGLP